MLRLIISLFYVWLCLLLACQTNVVDKECVIKVPIDSLSSLHTDFMTLAGEADELLLLKNQIQNTIDIFDLGKGEKVSSIYFVRHNSSAAEIQSVSYINADTLLVLKKNTPVLYYFNTYGHLYHRWNFPEKELIHFSITTNPPIIYNNKLYISVLKKEIASPSNNEAMLCAFEYEVNINTGEAHLMKLQLDQPTGLTSIGLRHMIPTRTLAVNELVYVWGGSKRILKYNLETKEIAFTELPIKSIVVENYHEEYTNNKAQQLYYFRNRVVDHMSYDKYRNFYYLYILDASPTASQKYQRGFKIIVLDQKFDKVSEKKIISNTYFFDHELITHKGLFLARNKPNVSLSNSDSLILRKIEF